MCFDPNVQVRVLRLLIILILLGAAPAGSVAAQAPQPSPPPSLGALFGGRSAATGDDPATRAARDPELLELARRFAVLARRPDVQLVSFALEHGQRAFRSASVALTGGKQQAAQRAKRIAWAALDLAARLLARNSAKLARSAAELRALTAERLRDQQRSTFELAQKRLVAARAVRP